MRQPLLIIASVLAVAGVGMAACSSSSPGTPGETVDSGTNKGDTGSTASDTGTATDTGTPSADTGSALADSGPSPADGGDSGSRPDGGSDAGTCSPSGMFQCPPPGAGCLSVDAGGSGFVMCTLGQICVTTDECDLSAQGAGCVDVPAAHQCSPCASAESTFANMGCPPGWNLNTTYTAGTPATGCTVDCN